MEDNMTFKTYTDEGVFQADCYQWFWNAYPEYRQTLFHVQQKAKNRIEGSRFKAMGVTKGVSDLILVLFAKVVFIELKLPKGTQSDEQKEFMSKVTTRGHEYVLIYTMEQFQQFVVRQIRLHGHELPF